VALEIESGTQRIPAEPLMLTGSGVVVGVLQRDAPVLEASARVRLILGSGDPDLPPIALRAVVRTSVLTSTHCQYRLRLCDPDELEGLWKRLPESPASCIERRLARRVTADPNLKVAMGAPGHRTVIVLLRDVSATGVSVMLPAQDDRDPLQSGCPVELHLCLPSESESVRLHGTVRRGLVIDQYVCYGIQLEPRGSKAQRRQQAALARYIAHRYLVERGNKLARSHAG
jgi:hypothetical protein